jgi:hypothetical protein
MNNKMQGCSRRGVEAPVHPRQGPGRPPPQGRRPERLQRQSLPQARAQLELSRENPRVACVPVRATQIKIRGSGL